MNGRMRETESKFVFSNRLKYSTVQYKKLGGVSSELLSLKEHARLEV